MFLSISSWPLSDSEALFTNAVLDVVWGWLALLNLYKMSRTERGTSDLAQLKKRGDTITLTCLFPFRRWIGQSLKTEMVNCWILLMLAALYIYFWTCVILCVLAMCIEQMCFHHGSKALKGQKRSLSVTPALVSLSKGKKYNTNYIACRIMLNTHLPITKSSNRCT